MRAAGKYWFIMISAVIVSAGIGLTIGYFLNGEEPEKSNLPATLNHNVPELKGLLDNNLKSTGLKEKETQEQLGALGYLPGYEKATGRKNVTIYEKDLCFDGMNLRVSGHAPQADLMDMKGEILHTWQCSFKSAFPNYPESPGPQHTENWRRVHLYPDGSILAIFDGSGMIKLDRQSEVVWTCRQRCHHDIFVDEDGLIYTLSREEHIISRIHQTEPVLEDFVLILNPNGQQAGKISILNAFENSSYASVLEYTPMAGDLMHVNTIEVFDGKLAEINPLFERGNALISLRHSSTIAILNLNQQKIVWALNGQWKRQHQPTLLPGGSIMLFDNMGHFGKSKVIEIDPCTQKILWAYYGTQENGFYSSTSGSCQPLPNGNVLISQSNSGRAFEVTRSGRIVWDYYNPDRAGKDNELVATLFEMVRLPRDYLKVSEIL